MTFYSIFVLLCTIALIYGGDSEQPTKSTPESPVQLAKEAFNIANQAQKVFNSALSSTGSIQKVNVKKGQLEQPNSQLTKPNCNLLGEIRTSLEDGMDDYLHAKTAIREGCKGSRLKQYIEHIQKPNPSYKFAKKTLSSVFDHAIKSFSNGQRILTDTGFAKASSQLNKFIIDVGKDYDENSEYFKDRLSREVDEEGTGSASATGGGGLFNGWFDGWFDAGSDSSVRPKDNNAKVAKLKAKLQAVLDFYLNLHKDVQNTVNELTQVNSLVEPLKQLTILKAQFDEAPEFEDHTELIILAKALDDLCEDYIQDHV